MRLAILIGLLAVSGCAGTPPPRETTITATTEIASALSSVRSPITQMNFPQTTDPSTQAALVVDRKADFPCLTCLAFVSQGGGGYGATAAIMDLHVISSAADVAFPRALVARIESACAACQPAAFTAQARGTSAATTVWAANFEAYSTGRASVAELNIGAAGGGYVFDVVPVRQSNGSPSQVDAVLKVEGFGNDPGAAKVGTYVDARINPTTAIVSIPAGQGPVTITATADGRMREVWSQTADGSWSRQLWNDGKPESLGARVAALEAEVAALKAALKAVPRR